MSKLPGVAQEQVGLGVLFLLLPGERLLSDHWPLPSCQLRLRDDVQNQNPGDKACPASRRLYGLQSIVRHTVLLIMKNCPQLR